MKCIFIGSDGSSSGKKAVIEFAPRMFSVHGVYGETSKPLDNLLGHCREVPFKDAEMILASLGKQITHYNGNSYTREIPNVGKAIKKRMKGHPIIKINN